MVNKRAYDPEASLRTSDGSLDPLIRKQNSILERKLDSRPWFRCDSLSLCILICIILPTAIILMVIYLDIDQTNDGNSCFVEHSCQLTDGLAYNQDTGFTNDTGWDSATSTDCCNICIPGAPSKICFDESDVSSDCMVNKEGKSGDFDYLMFDQIWLPQFCNALSAGHDPTLSHLEGSICNTRNTRNNQNKLIIHGLWPNYYEGFPQCCNDTNNLLTPLVPSEVVDWNIWGELESEWFDPTTTTTTIVTGLEVTVVSTADESDYCNVCYMLNHEWMKHGSCYSNSDIDMATADPKEYFISGLGINELLVIPSQNISDLAGQSGVLTQTLVDFYPTGINVNIICDAFNTDADEGTFLEVQTCWTVIPPTNKGNLVPGSSNSYTMVSCQPASDSHFTKSCPTYVTIPQY